MTSNSNTSISSDPEAAIKTHSQPAEITKYRVIEVSSTK